MDFSTILYTVENGVATIALNRPEKLNAISDRMIEELSAAVKDSSEHQKARALILTGSGRAFSAGGDLSEIKDSYGGPVGFQKHMQTVTDFLELFTDLPLPVIAAVNGIAAGAGANLALACDFVLMSETAVFSELFSTIGLVGDWGGMYFLPRLVGRQRAKELFFTGRKVGAAECRQLGIALEVYPPEELMNAARLMAQRYAQGPTAAYGLIKKAVNQSFEASLRTVMDYEGLSQVICSFSEDHREGLNAMAEKRSPQFKGK